MADITLGPNFKVKFDSNLEDMGPEDKVVHIGRGTFGATDDAAELATAVNGVEFFSGTCLGATQSTAGEYVVTTDGTVTSSAITVCREGHGDAAHEFYFMIIGTPEVAQTS